MDRQVLERLLRIAVFVPVAAWFGLLFYNSNRLDNPVILAAVLVSFGAMLVATIAIEGYRQKLTFLNNNPDLERLKIEEDILTNAHTNLRQSEEDDLTETELSQKYSAQNAELNRTRAQAEKREL